MFLSSGSLRLAIYAIAATASLTLTQPIAHADDAVTISYSYKEGSTEHYKMTTTLIGVNAVVKSTTSVTIKEVKPSGEVTMVRKVENGTLTQNGQDRAVPTDQPITEIYDKLGKLTDFKADKEEEATIPISVQNLLALSNHVILPQKPVKPGDTWENSINNPVVKGKKVTINDTYLGKEKKDGVELWKVKQSLVAIVSDDGDKMTSELMILLDPTNGHEVESTNVINGVPTNSGVVFAWKSQSSLIKGTPDTKTP